MDLTPEHTPGPWSVDTQGDASPDVMHDQTGESLASCWVEACGPAEALANAHLIAAAPELMDALVDLVEQIAAYEFVHGENSSPIWPEAAKAAIAKARGEIQSC